MGEIMRKEPGTVGDVLDQLPVARATTPMQMLDTAISKGASIEVLERLLALQERWEANEARKAFVAALSGFKANPPTVVKNKQAGFDSKRTGDRTEYEYATLDQVCALIAPALSRHGLSHRWEIAQADGRVRVTCILTHELGHSERVTLEAGADQSGSKNPIQAIGSTCSYLERYTLLAAVGLAAKEQDDDTRGAFPSQFITADQKDELIGLMKETGADTARFLKYLGVPSLDELPATGFARAKTALEVKRERGTDGHA